MRTNRKGFTIVELLIVIVVVAILATISVAAYNGVQKRANQSLVKQDFSNIKKKLEFYKIEHGRYPAGEVVDTIQVAKSAYRTDIFNVFYTISANGEAYCFAASAKGESGGAGYRMCSGGAIQEITDMSGAAHHAALPGPTVWSRWLYYGSDGWRI